MEGRGAVGQKKCQLGSWSHCASSVNVRWQLRKNICVLSAKGADKEAVSQSLISFVSSVAADVRDAVEWRAAMPWPPACLVLARQRNTSQLC